MLATLSLLLLTTPTLSETRIATVEFGGVTYTLVMHPISLRAPDFALIETTGTTHQTLTPDPPRTWQGSVREDEGATVAAALNPATDEFRAIIRLSNGQVWEDDSIPPGAITTVTTTTAATSGTPDDPGDVSADIQFVEIAVDTDVELSDLLDTGGISYFSQLGSGRQAVLHLVEELLNVVDSTFRSQVGVSYELTTLVVRPSEPDPYDAASSGGVLLEEVEAVWNGIGDANLGVEPDSILAGRSFDVVHMMTGKSSIPSPGGGLRGVCESDNFVSYARPTASYYIWTQLMSHEFGHTWYARHCNDPRNTYPPTGQPDCALMCAYRENAAGEVITDTCPSPGRPLFFSDFSRGAILDHKNRNEACLTRGTLYVDRLAGPGGTGSQARPYRTVVQAVMSARPRSIVRIVRSGDYSAPFTSSKPLTIEATGGAVVIGTP